MDRVTDAARAVYTLYGAPKALVVEHPGCEHDFPDSIREKAYAFLKTALESTARG